MSTSKVSLDTYNFAKIFTQFKDKNGNYVFNLNDTISVILGDANSDLYISHLVSAKDTYQTISYKYYGTTRLWWLIAKLNNIEDATVLPAHTTIVKVLNPSLLNTVLSSLTN